MFLKQYVGLQHDEFEGSYIPLLTLNHDLHQINNLAEGVPISNEATHQWLQSVERKSSRVGSFMQEQTGLIQDRIESLKAILGPECPTLSDFTTVAVMNGFGEVSERIFKLRSFADVNSAALLSLLREHDVMFNSSEGQRELFERYSKLARVGDLKVLDAFDEDVKNCIVKMQSFQADARPEVALLSAGQRSYAASTTSMITQQSYGFFFLGSFVSFLSTFALLVAIPGEYPESFRPAAFLLCFCAFQVGLIVTMVFFWVGLVISVCDSKGINYVMMLGIDPRFPLSASAFFNRAALHGAGWLFFFGLYLLDSKWPTLSEPVLCAFGNCRDLNQDRTSKHYYIYPAAELIFMVIVLLLWPIHEKQWGLLKSFGRTLMAPCFAVFFCDVLMSDIFASNLRGFQDLIGTACMFSYLSEPHQADLKVFEKYGDVCPDWHHKYTAVLVSIYPNVCSMMQNLRRFHHTRKAKFAFNSLKYLLGISVSLLTSLMTEKTWYIVAPAMASVTLYSWFWDVYMDWGLSDLFLSQKADDDKKSLRMYGSHVYLAAAILNLLGRLSWVTTLVPISFVSDKMYNRSAVLFITISIELARRSMWTILKFECEQLYNGEAYRSLLWSFDARTANKRQLKSAEEEYNAEFEVQEDEDCKKHLRSSSRQSQGAVTYGTLV